MSRHSPNTRTRLLRDASLLVLLCAAICTTVLVEQMWFPSANVTGPGPPPPPSVPPPSPAPSPTEHRLAWNVSYEESGRVSSIEDPAGGETTFEYGTDNQERISRVTKQLPDGNHVTLHYDRWGRRTEMQDGQGAVEYEYDEFGRLRSVNRQNGPAISYHYDTLDRIETLTVGESWKVEYEFDFLGRLAELKTPAGTISYDYNSGRRRVARELPNGVRTVWQYQPDGSLESLSHVTADNTTLCAYEYAYRPDGLIERIDEESDGDTRTLMFVYDNVQRLTEVRDSAGETIGYDYDPFGNRTEVRQAGGSIASEYDWAGRLTNHDNRTAKHDPVGNLTKYIAADKIRRFDFTSDSKLAAAGSRDKEIQYAYDGDGNLISRQVGGVTTRYVPDPMAEIWRPLAEEDDAGNGTFYVWDGDQPVAAIDGEEVTFFLHDRIGSVRRHVNGQGEVLNELHYNPFGAPQDALARTGPFPGFAGMYYDPAAEVYLTRARAYDPVLGRFLQRDPQIRLPLGSQKDLSAYAYCGADPVNFVDLTGAEPSRPEDPAERATLYWADLFNRGHWWAAVPGVLSALGMEENRTKTALVLATGSMAGGLLAVKGGAAASMSFGTGLLGRLAGGVATALDIVSKGATTYSVTQDSLDLFSDDPYSAAIRLSKDFAVAGAPAYAKTLKPTFTLPVEWGLYGGIKGIEWNDAVRTPRDAWARFARRRVPNRGRVVGGRNNSPILDLARSMSYHRYGGSGGGGGSGNSPLLDAVREMPYATGDALPDDVDGTTSPTYTIEFDDDAEKGLTPTNAGGVYLSGAGQALGQLGALNGIAVDENGRLILLAEDGGTIDLPPLYLDDVVTIFRAVYQGKSPFVSIDPHPEEPEGPVMNVRHDAATEGTRVGWVLFQADRLMKCYVQGFDNATRKRIVSRVPGYGSRVDTVDLERMDLSKKSKWERFWFVPADCRRRTDSSGSLALLDARLQLKGEATLVKKGRYHTDPDRLLSKHGATFCRWFTEHYDDVAREVLLSPPATSGDDRNLPIFAELRRMTLIAGIAEVLRDQGVPLPTWMEAYQVRPWPVFSTTQAIVSVKTDAGTHVQLPGTELPSERYYRWYGGVDLLPSDLAIDIETDSPQANAVAAELKQAMSGALPLDPIRFEVDQQRYKAVALPGTRTRALGACRLSCADLAVPAGRNRRLQLIRHFHSFFRPAGEFGNAWVLDAPYLQRHLARNREEGESEYIYQLGTPLNSVCEVFRRRERVPGFRYELHVPNRPCGVLGIGATRDERIGMLSKVVYFKDEREWHFDEDGKLVAIERPPYLTVYRRQEGRLQSLEAWTGKRTEPDAVIQLAYDDQARLSSARSSDGRVVKYQYNDHGLLERVEGPDGSTQYQYVDGNVERVIRNGVMSRQFVYAAGGRLRRVVRGDGPAIDYDIEHAATGRRIVSRLAGQADRVAEFDHALRPVKRVEPDGTQVTWSYRDSGEIEMAATSSDGRQYSVLRSGDRDHDTWTIPEGGQYHVRFDDAGRVATVSAGDREMLRKDYRHNGQLDQMVRETSVFDPYYDDDGVIEGFSIGAADKDLRQTNWLHVDMDAQGRPIKLTDSTRLDVEVQRDEHGRAIAVKLPNATVSIKRNETGNVERIDTSWGLRQMNTYGADGSELKEAEIQVGQDRAIVEFDKGRPTRILNFDEGELLIAYSSAGKVQQVTTQNGIILNYEISEDDRDVSVDCGRAIRFEVKRDDQGRVTNIAQTAIAAR